MTLRDQIRAEIFSADNRKPEVKELTFFGQKVEVRQPLISDVMDMADGDNKSSMISMLINYTYVPGSNDRVFEEADGDSLRQMPFNKDFARFIEVVQDLTDLDLSEAEGN